MATEVARELRAKILARTQLTASAGISYNKLGQAGLRPPQAQRAVRDSARARAGVRGRAGGRRVSRASGRPPRRGCTRWASSPGRPARPARGAAAPALRQGGRLLLRHRPRRGPAPCAPRPPP
ncbi:MAG: hypothetical protein WKG07_31770 [Hymenobacter sp.]